MTWGKSVLLPIPLLLSGIFVVASPASAERVGTETDWTAIATGGSHTCGIRSSKLYCWGNNDNGQVGNGDDDFQTVPDRIGGSSEWTAVSTGAAHTCGIRSRKLFCWGSDSEGQLGNGSSGSQDEPQQVSGANWIAVTAGSAHTCAIRSDRILACWGSDEHGQIGNGPGGSPVNPTLVSAAKWKSISAGAGHTCGVRTDGMIACWGDDSNGQIGNGDAGSPTRPTKISGGSWKSVSAGRAHSCGIRTDNLLACWGSDASGQVGNGPGGNATKPVKVSTNYTDWRLVSAGGAHSCATRGAGALYCWGDNSSGQVTGVASSTPRTTPLRHKEAGVAFADYRGIDAGSRTSCGVRANGKLYCWGGDEPTVTCSVAPYIRPSGIDLSYWKLTTPVDGTDSGSTADEIKYGGSPDLATLHDQNVYYYAKPLSGGTRFQARADGATTSNSQYARSELREMTQGGGYDEASWDRSSGTHRMRIHQRIYHTFVAKPEVVAGQIHDGSDDVLQVRLEGTELMVTWDDGNDSRVLDSSYTRGDDIDLLIQADDCGIAVKYNGGSLVTIPVGSWDNGEWYFKAGVYNQSNVAQGDSASRYGEVTIFGLDVEHS